MKVVSLLVILLIRQFCFCQKDFKYVGDANFEVSYRHFREPEDGNNVIIGVENVVYNYDLIMNLYVSYLRFNNIASVYDTYRSGSVGKTQNYIGDAYAALNSTIFTSLPDSINIKETRWKAYTEYINISPIQWEITKEELMVNGIRCIKANGVRPPPGPEFLSDTYTAWFSPDIPVPFGPYQFFGLPGLIVKCKWSNLVIEATGIKNISANKHMLKVPTSINTISMSKKMNDSNKMYKEAVKEQVNKKD